MEDNVKGQENRQSESSKRNKGGRPKVPNKRSEIISVMCSLLEKKIIQVSARRSGTNASVFLRELGLHGKVSQKVKSLPKATLQLIGTLNHVAANLNQLAKKRNSVNDLNAMERALLNQEVRTVQSVVKAIKQYLSWPSEK